MMDSRGDTPTHYEGRGHQAYGPRDKALTAFAQLATLRLDVKWAMISLIDVDRQYVLAKATKTLSLYSYTTDRPEDEVWLGNSTISKDDAACHHVFNSTYVAREESGEAYAADCLFVSDCREDSLCEQGLREGGAGCEVLRRRADHHESWILYWGLRRIRYAPHAPPPSLREAPC